MGPSQPQACLQGLGPCLEVTAEHATAAAPEEAKPPPRSKQAYVTLVRHEHVSELQAYLKGKLPEPCVSGKTPEKHRVTQQWRGPPGLPDAARPTLLLAHGGGIPICTALPEAK